MDFEVILTDGSTVTVYDREMETPEAVRFFLASANGGRPGWVQLGNLVCYSQNIVGAVFPDDDEPDQEAA